MGDPKPGDIFDSIRNLLRRVGRLEKSASSIIRGIVSPGVRTTTVTNSPVQVYVDAAGRFGISASTLAKKNVTGPYAVDMNKFLAVNLVMWQYKDNPGASGMGPIADALDAAGLNEFVIYNLDGSIQGVRSDMLIIGLWSAYVQSRATTLKRIANQAHQTVTVPVAAAVAIGATKTYPVVWSAPFIDADYMVVASVYTSAGVLVSGVTAAVNPASKTAAGCTVQVSTTVALLSTMSIVVEAVHI